MSFSHYLTKFSRKLYRLVFKEDMNPTMVTFVRNLSWVGVSNIISAGLLALFSMLGGRFLGPEEYGRYALIQSVAMFLYIPMKMGFNTAMLKYTSEKDEFSRQRIIVSTTYILIAILTIVSVIFMLFGTQQLSQFFATTPELFRFSILFAVFFLVFDVGQVTLRSVNRMKSFAIAQPLQAFFKIIAFFVFLIVGELTFETMLFPMLLGYGIVGFGIHLFFTRKYFAFEFSGFWLKTLSRFSFAALISLVSTTIYNQMNKIILVHYMTEFDVGIFMAYTTATLSFSMVFWSAFNFVFFPAASKTNNKKALFRKINKLTPFIVLGGLPLLMGIGYIMLQVYGENYTFNLLWLTLASLTAVFQIIRAFYTSFLMSSGHQGALMSSGAAVIAAIVITGLSILLVPVSGITGALLASIAAYLSAILLLFIQAKKSVGKISDSVS